MSIKIGDKIKVLPKTFSTADDQYNPQKDNKKEHAIIGTVVTISPRFYTVEFKVAGGKIRESFTYTEPYEIISST